MLFTSYAQMNDIYQRLLGEVEFPMLRQGDAPKNALLEEFRLTPNAVLFATSSFWQGVDVQGEQLSCVIIDRLPFAVPSDPVVAARVKAIDADGGNAFFQYQVPAAVITLKQGFGRLIRSLHDRGLLVLLDNRILKKQYGRVFVESLPNYKRTTDDAEWSRNFFGVRRTETPNPRARRLLFRFWFLYLGITWHHDSRRLALAVIHALRGFHESPWAWRQECSTNVLWVAVSQREPRALHLHHDAVAAAEGVIDVWHGEVDLFDFSRRERLRLFKAVAEFSAEWLASHQLLISPHRELRAGTSFRVCLGLPVGVILLAVRVISRIHVDQLHVPIGIRAAGRYEKSRRNRPRDGHVFLQDGVW